MTPIGGYQPPPVFNTTPNHDSLNMSSPPTPQHSYNNNNDNSSSSSEDEGDMGGAVRRRPPTAMQDEIQHVPVARTNTYQDPEGKEDRFI